MNDSSPWQRQVKLPIAVWYLLVAALAFMVTFGISLNVRLNVQEALATSAVIVTGGFLIYTLFYALVMFALGWLRRVAIERAVVGQIANIVRQKLPLAQAMTVAAQSERGLASGYLEAISSYLAAGLPLSESIHMGWPNCPSMVLSLIIAGERSGQLPMAVEQAQEFLTWKSQRRERLDVPVIPYAIVVTAATCLVTAGMMVAIVPKFKEIFKDFGVRLPWLTVRLIDVSEFTAFWIGPLAVALLITLIVWIYVGFRPRRQHDPRWSSRIADWLRWHTPGLRAMEESRGLATGMETIRMGVRSGMNLPQAVELAAGIDVNYQLRKKLREFANALSAGQEVRSAAARARLSSIAGLALSAGQRSNDLETALVYAADYHYAIFSRAWIILTRLAWPVTTVCLGLLVAFVVVALFLPLVVLINSVSGGW